MHIYLLEDSNTFWPLSNHFMEHLLYHRFIYLYGIDVFLVAVYWETYPVSALKLLQATVIIQYNFSNCNTDTIHVL